MKLVLDNNVLIQILAPNATGLTDPETQATLDRLDERAAALVAEADRTGAVMVIPAPVLAEFLIGVEPGSFQEYLDILNGNTCFEIADFDTAAAIECAQLPDKKELAQISPGQVASKLVYDRQIVSIAITAMADEIWSHDGSLRKIAASRGLRVKSLADIKPAPQQMSFPDAEELE